MSLENQRNWLRLAMVPGMSFGGSYALLKAFGLPETIFAQSVLSLSTVLPQELAVLVHRSPGEDVETKIQTILAWIKNIPQVRLLVPSDKDFPKRFLTVPQPPMVVLAAGDVKLLSRETVSLVGSSHPSADAELTTRSWVSALIKKELSLIQGEAPGIEKIGLLTALKSKVPSLVIVSKNPLTDDNFEQKLSFILNKGLLISPLETAEDPWLMRQRLLVASTDHFVVIESSIRSRVLSLVREAADAGRNVMAVPGSIHSPLSKGCHKLIREGAKLVESADDIWDEIKN